MAPKIKIFSYEIITELKSWLYKKEGKEERKGRKEMTKKKKRKQGKEGKD